MLVRVFDLAQCKGMGFTAEVFKLKFVHPVNLDGWVKESHLFLTRWHHNDFHEGILMMWYYHC